MNILLIDSFEVCLDFALRCMADDHDVRVFMTPSAKDGKALSGNGLVTKITDWRGSLKWADLIVTTANTKYLKELDGYRAQGYPIFGATWQTAQWEMDRELGVKVFEAHGIKCLPSVAFKTYREGVEYVRANPERRLVCKPIGDVRDKSLSYVSKSSRDMLFMLEKWQREGKRIPYIFQDFAPGIEMAVGAWVGKNGFSSYVLENFEFKKLMPGEVGVNTGEMGTVMKYVPASESKLFQDVLAPLEPELIRQGYTGYIDVAVIVDKQGQAWPLEFTSRMGWPLFLIQQVLHKQTAQWMLDLLHGLDTFEPYDEIAVGVLAAMQDFPYDMKPRDTLCGFPVWGVNEKNRYYFHPISLQAGTGPELVKGKLTEKPLMVSAGNELLVMSGVGDTVAAACEHAYKNLKDIELANSPLYRTDIGLRLQAQLPELQKLGYATSWSYE